MQYYATPRSLELWRSTTPEISGRACTQAPWHAAEGAGVLVRDYALPSVSFQVRADAGYVGQFPDAIPLSVEPPREGRLVALVENPLSRLREVWRNYTLNPIFRAQQPRRFAGAWGVTFGSFVRWVMQQDPLGCDILIRPQWAFLPERTELYKAPSLVVERSLCALQAAELLYAHDLPLWQRAADLTPPAA